MLLRNKITQIFCEFDEYLKINFTNIDNSFSLTSPLEMSFSCILLRNWLEYLERGELSIDREEVLRIYST